MKATDYSYGKIVKCKDALVYQKPTIQSKLVGSIPRGTEVMIISDTFGDSYFHNVISPSGVRGYCMSVFTEVIVTHTKELGNKTEEVVNE